MQRAPKTKEEIENDPIKLREKTMARARQRQTENQNNYMKQKDDIKDEIKAVEGYDIKEKMLKERRDWILEQQAITGKPPADFEKFYEKVEVDPDAPAEDEAAPAGKKGKEAKKGGKGGGEDDEKEDKLAKIGPNELVQKFEVYYNDY